MTPLLTEHHKWSPSIKRFYGKYHSTARFVGFAWNDPMSVHLRWDGLYRTRNSYSYRDRFSARATNVPTKEFIIYTSELELLEELLFDKHFESKLDYIATPRDEKHRSDLENTDEHIVFRSKLYYGKYEYKVEANVSYWRNPPDPDVVRQAVKYVDDTFTDTRAVYSDGRTHVPRTRYSPMPGLNSGYPGVVSIPKFPTLYTNDKSSLFLLKMSWGTELNLVTERVVIV
jgi:hypothetical protein